MTPLFLTKLLVRAGVARHLPAVRRRALGGEDYLHYYADRVLGAPVEALTDPATFPSAPTADVIDLNVAAPQFASPLSLGRRPRRPARRLGPAGVARSGRPDSGAATRAWRRPRPGARSPDHLGGQRRLRGDA